MTAPGSGLPILVVYTHVPTPDRDGGSLRMVNILKLLVALGAQVTLVPSDPPAQPESAPAVRPYVAQLRAAGVQVISAPEIESVRQHLEAYGRRYAVVLLSGGVYHAYPHLGATRELAPQASVWFDTLDLAYVREYRRARLLGSRPALERALEIKRRTLRTAAQADWTLVVSEAEAEALRRDAPEARLHVLSNIHEVHGPGPAFGARRGLVFIGAYPHLPNLDGLKWFVAQVLPLVRPALPGVCLSVIGADPPPEALALAGPQVRLAGYVADLGPVYDACRLSIAPLRFGAGVKGKVLLSLGYGVPVVGTRLAAEGSHLVDGENARLADTPEDFAQAIVEVYTQPELWQRLARNGQQTVARHFSFDSAREQLRQLLAAERI
jgi:glycosyltransferase involved in cell wall biosynthesis